ncbi:hypothetical protein LNTAR_05536 [Lentisphaera araneosa HTCC2155]|uniref:Uncharacterized protein n=1 Tax=Lentisphaera araneosa HTCC2155 TaxID=313628 RepID=A6DLU4_9BACT|nr:DUF3592 domain-containing protein [Lentisphaera araneosa]EDM27549.1 hypothetical protein LNTAR_05536 [Lentisphaera araneosa HTCC2155]
MIIDKFLDKNSSEAMYFAGLTLSIPLLCLGIIWAILSTVILLSFDTSLATVIDHKTEKDTEGNMSYTAIVAYQSVNGPAQTSTLTLSSSEKSPPLQKQVKILYKTSSPKLVFIKSFKGLYFTPLFLLVLAFFSHLISLAHKKAYKNSLINKQQDLVSHA